MLDKNRDLLRSAQTAFTEKIHREHSWDKKVSYWDSFLLAALKKKGESQ